MFSLAALPVSSGHDLILIAAEGAVIGLIAVGLSKSVYFIEDQFERLPIHWMWWPMLGGLAVGGIGYYVPSTLGVGYENIDHVLSGQFVGPALMIFCVAKFLSWSIALGSGTSGGTLAPLFTIGGWSGVAVASVFPALSLGSVDLRLAALVGMASCFAGASRAFFTSIVFAFETTREPNGVVPLLVGCTAAYIISALAMKHTIMTEKLARRGHHVPNEYSADVVPTPK